MRKLAWWTIGVGLLCMGSRGVDFFLPPMGEFTQTVYDFQKWREAINFLRVLGIVVFFLGALLLPATVIADAIREVRGTRRGP